MRKPWDEKPRLPDSDIKTEDFANMIKGGPQSENQTVKSDNAGAKTATNNICETSTVFPVKAHPEAKIDKSLWNQDKIIIVHYFQDLQDDELEMVSKLYNKLVLKYNDRFVFIKADVDKNCNLIQNLKLDHTPTIVAYNNSEELDRVVSCDEQEIEKFLLNINKEGGKKISK